MNVNETFLKQLGFIDFVPLRKEDRDFQRRLTKIVTLAGRRMIIQLINDDGIWNIEKLIYDGDKNILEMIINSNSSVNEIVDLFFPLSNEEEKDRTLIDPLKL